MGKKNSPFSFFSPPLAPDPKRGQPNPGSKDKVTALILFIVGFIIGWSWLIGWILYRKSPNEDARKFAKISGILFIVQFILGIVVSLASFAIAFASIISIAAAN